LILIKKSKRKSGGKRNTIISPFGGGERKGNGERGYLRGKRLCAEGASPSAVDQMKRGGGGGKKEGGYRLRKTEGKRTRVVFFRNMELPESGGGPPCLSRATRKNHQGRAIMKKSQKT